MNLRKYNFLTWHRRDDLSLWLLAKTLALVFGVVCLFVGLTLIWYQLGL